MSIGPDKLLGIRSIHADVAFVVLVEISPDRDDVFWTARVESKAKTDVRDEIIEALLPVESRSREREGKSSGVFNPEGEGRTDVTDSSFRDGAEAGSVSPPFAPGGKAPVGGGFPGVHPDRQHGKEPLVCREFPTAFAKA